jgi:hypothetical protein
LVARTSPAEKKITTGGATAGGNASGTTGNTTWSRGSGGNYGNTAEAMLSNLGDIDNSRKMHDMLMENRKNSAAVAAAEKSVTPLVHQEALRRAYVRRGA